MKQFWFNLTVAVVAETETEALEKFCNNPGAFDFCHDDLTTTFIEDLEGVDDPLLPSPQLEGTMKRGFWDWVATLILAVLLFSLGWGLAFIVVRALEAL